MFRAFGGWSPLRRLRRWITNQWRKSFESADELARGEEVDEEKGQQSTAMACGGWSVADLSGHDVGHQVISALKCERVPSREIGVGELVERDHLGRLVIIFPFETSSMAVDMEPAQHRAIDWLQDPSRSWFVGNSTERPVFVWAIDVEHRNQATLTRHPETLTSLNHAWLLTGRWWPRTLKSFSGDQVLALEATEAAAVAVLETAPFGPTLGASFKILRDWVGDPSPHVLLVSQSLRRASTWHGLQAVVAAVLQVETASLKQTETVPVSEEDALSSALSSSSRSTPVSRHAVVEPSGGATEVLLGLHEGIIWTVSGTGVVEASDRLMDASNPITS